MVDERLQRQIQFLVEIDELKGVLRRNPVMDGSRLENTAEHSWHLVMMALVLAEHADEPVDTGRVASMVAVHDLVEIDAGDTYAYDTAGAETKAAREREAADRIFGLLPGGQGTELRALWDEFEAGETADARFALAIDRLMPLLHNHHTDGRVWHENGIHPDRVRARMEAIGRGSAALAAHAATVIDASVEAGHFPH
jgi:putative hydrolase of HD superfamily